MNQKNTVTEQICVPMTVDVPYRFAAGKYMARFLTELRDNGRFVGVKCPSCNRVQMPPRVVCAACHVKNDEWVELSSEGTMVGFTIMYLPLTDPTTGKPHEPPFVYGSVRLDGSDSTVEHMVNVEPDLDKIWVGMRMKVVLRDREERIGDLSDIIHFEPLPGQKRPQ
ncbi:hypothetical protein SAMN02745216_03954 [Desulfatibacillum alkenivorans DSM 16219]|uniref:DUF35 domain-containing protein n=1 Tax=Desulfatibacillum alkenivorans DSM 16219 TaxID=1121393 RepID=A0A1M6UQ06_9BACT|nr:Zn-ribbon domain-containing OB-fold protein [Desulfatibacillum alkenivorans]SHK71240.1 hypothetical protein SAMN02745216_03954 [Desulfatibacillum alkenivorans DSM 16219]